MFWLALAVFLVSVGGGLLVAARNGLKLFRQMQRLRQVGGAAIDDLTARTELLSRNAARSGAQGDRVERSVERLDRSLARLRILREAVGGTDGSRPGPSRART